ncbi:putative calcium-binding protein [Trifolium medium]|uniref:Putative calcium-binding protein n=1 Tax=Trifolium medium TaxID=97028 RepID=A0A392NM39_9FABA|nr:putative calcium-binding protein [Trifolium medium]
MCSLTESDGFTFLRADNEDCITYSGFCEALRQFVMGKNTVVAVMIVVVDGVYCRGFNYHGV